MACLSNDAAECWQALIKRREIDTAERRGRTVKRPRRNRLRNGDCRVGYLGRSETFAGVLRVGCCAGEQHYERDNPSGRSFFHRCSPEPTLPFRSGDSNEDITPVEFKSITDQAGYGRETEAILSVGSSSSWLEAVNFTSMLMNGHWRIEGGWGGRRVGIGMWLGRARLQSCQ